MSLAQLSNQKRWRNKYTNHLSKPLLHRSCTSLGLTPGGMLSHSSTTSRLPAPRLLCYLALNLLWLPLQQQLLEGGIWAHGSPKPRLQPWERVLPALPARE